MISSLNKVEHRVVVLGPGGVGKSCLCIQFIQGHFVQAYDPTVEDSYRKQIDLDGTPHMIELLDTAGQDQFASMREQYMKSGDAFVLVYSIADEESFNAIARIYEHLLRVKGTKSVPCILVGNKADLKHERCIEFSEGQDLASTWGVLFCETSALYRKTPHIDTTPSHMQHMIGTEDVFMRVLRLLVKPHAHATTGRGGMGIDTSIPLHHDTSSDSMDAKAFQDYKMGNLTPRGNLPILTTKRRKRLCTIL